MSKVNIFLCGIGTLALLWLCADLRAEGGAKPPTPPIVASEDADSQTTPAAATSVAANEPHPAMTPAPVAGASVEPVTERFPNGSIKVERQVTKDAGGNYINHGPYTAYDTNGKIQKTGQFLNGKQQGLWTQTFAKDDGHLFSADQDAEFIGPFTSEATFVDGQLQGTWTIKNHDGRNIVEWNFDHGVRDGKWTWWYPNGQQRLEATYKNNKLDGEVTEWSPDGKQIAKSTYIDGKRLVRMVGWYTLGQKRFEGCCLRTADIPDAAYDWWNGNVTISGSIPTTPDLKHGTWIEWYPNGKKKLEAQYDHNVAVGKFTWWYQNGQKQAEVEYAAGVLDGLWITWHPNGLKESQAQHRNGELVNKWLHWNADGKLIEVRDPQQASTGATTSPSTSQQMPTMYRRR